MKQKLLAFLMLILVAVTGARAQNRLITGKVTAAEDGLPLPGVSVKVKGAAVGASTNVDGSYSINLPSGASVLEFTYIGFQRQEVSVGTSSQINVKLSPDSKVLSEVIVTGFGQKQQKRDATGANAVISGNDIANTPVQSFDKAIQGKAAGVQVSSASGVPGGGVSINIRGINSINAGSEPLYIIDGVEVVSGDQSRNFPTSNALAGINPSDIESINIMKDAAAASIYGAQAANGVVIITTKKGRSGKSQLNFGAYTGFSQVIKKQPVLNSAEFITLSREAVINRFGSIAAATPAVRNLLNGFGDPATAPFYDWQDAVFRNGMTQNYDLSLAGGDERTKFYLSGSYNNQTGQVISQDFKRGNVRVNVDHKLSNKFSIETRANLSSFKQNGTSAGTAFISPNRTAMLTMPLNRIYNDDGSYNTDLRGAYPLNVVMENEYNDLSANTIKALGNFALNYQITRDLKLRTSYSVDYTHLEENEYWDPRSNDGAGLKGYAAVYNTSVRNFNTDQTINYNRQFGKHRVTAIGGMSYKNETVSGNSAEGTGFPSFQFRTLRSAAVVSDVDAFDTGYKQIGYFARGDYAFNDKYLASATIRYDGSSRFGDNNRYGAFPAVSAGWRISKERFLSDISWIEDIKLRASYGILGNSRIGDFAARSLYTGAGDYNGEPGLSPTLGNDNLTWEEAATWDAGVDFSFFRNRISGSFGGFIKTTSQLLLDRNLPVTSGFSNILTNIGKLDNRGLEAELNTTNISTKNFTWETRFNATFLKSELLELNDGLQSLSNAYFVGQPLLTYNAPKYAGVNPADGNPMWYDKNGNLTYNPVAADRQFLGSQLPKGFGGLTNTLTYRGISVSAMVQYQYGNKINNTDAQFLRRMGSTLDRNQDRSELRRWQKPGDMTDTPKPYYNTGVPTGAQAGGVTYIAPYALVSSRFIEDGSYVRLKEVSLSYNLPSALLGKAGLRSMRVYGQAYNLLTLTKFSGVDPEFQGTSTTRGTYSGIVPQFKNLTFGVQVGF